MKPETSAGSAIKWGIGSQWQRWDPHLHAPGTLRNDQFKQDWDGYVRRIEEADPAPVALGITDYLCLRGYKEVRARMGKGALSQVPLVFPNIELRLTIETKDRQGINLHLLVCPDDPEHVPKIEAALARLQFQFRGEIHPCSEDGLRRLGRAHHGDPTLADGAALSEGANQFKVELSKVRELFHAAWVRDNVLVAVAAGDDGLSGIAGDAAFHGSREELGRFAHVIFSGNPGDRAYWLGKHPDFERNGQTPKPCLHGSDAHSIGEVLEPDLARRCWIRATPTFDGLRQTLVEPDRRVHIGEVPPSVPSPSQTIRRMRFRGATWLANEAIEFNEGLVTVIGAKGSGKTALADLLAFGADASEPDPGPASFIAKAGDLLKGLEVELEWKDGSPQSRTIGDSDFTFDEPEPKVRYLSQQFVERLCSPGPLGEPLVEEIERVVFSAIPQEDRLECTTFAELRSLQVEGHEAEQESEREAIRNRTNDIAEEQALQRSMATLKLNVQTAERERATLEKELAGVPLKVDPVKLKAHETATAALQALKTSIAAAERKAQEVRDLTAELKRQSRAANEQLAPLKGRFPTLADLPLWGTIRLTLPSEVVPTLETLEKETRTRASSLRLSGSPTLFSKDTEAKGLVALEAAVQRATTELGADQTKVARRTDLEKRLQVARRTEDGARKALTHAEKGPARLKEAWDARLAAYEAVFQALAAEEETLRSLYSPLRARIELEPRLAKLSFAVKRVVDVDTWATRGEALVDLRRPPFQRRGQIAELARKLLLPAWTNGTTTEVRSAMEVFLRLHVAEAVEALAQGVTPLNLGEWLFSTDHVKVRYGIRYEDVDISNLSPGTRGVVLLALYLSLDESDLRPLVIDQPEENLDPRSIYDDLLPYFRTAARRRQIIMVTHNANLVVNTDSDQVIVAEAARTSVKELPHVTYLAGGLEDDAIRRSVCRLLEGGEDAFKRRGRRYGVTSDRT